MILARNRNPRPAALSDARDDDVFARADRGMLAFAGKRGER